MEQATNQFNKGLQMDTHPMVQGNDSLTDCLNGTLITMNGNEVVLQNDMGNRRVDNAFLPAGYEPVGIKEYGGIIYVAAYNPITNRSQVGSFPSPERKLGEEYKDSLGGYWNPSTTFTASNNTTEDEELKFIIADTSLLRLTGDTSLHVGDKFAIYSSDIWNNENITNLNNITGNKVTSPKNKLYTLALGILNSQNEFVDITKTLHRWNGNTIINEEGKSELYKFNDGYFIASQENSGWYRTETQDDAQLLRERLAKPINTYAYKLTGPLYLKTKLNHIEQISYNIYGTFKQTTNESSTTNETTLWIESIITYNCPDGVTDGGNSDDNYYTYDEGTPKFSGFDFYVKEIVDNKEKYVKKEASSTKFSNSFYDLSTNLYTVKVLKTYNLTQGGIIYYYFCVPGITLNKETYYLKGLSEKGEIDTSLLGSGEVELTGWRFYNSDSKQTTLTYSFKAYPKYQQSFSDLKFTFTNVKDSSNIITLTETDGLVLNNGKNTIIFNWEEKEFKERCFYDVTISYKASDEQNDQTIDTEWFLTTQLFNNCYRASSDDYLQRYSLINSDSKYLKVELDADCTQINESDSKQITQTGKLMSKANELINIDGQNYIYMNYKHEQPITLSAKFNLKIKNEELYPLYIELTSTDIPVTLSSPKLNTNELLSQIEYATGNKVNYPADTELISSELGINNNGKITGSITYYDKFLSQAASTSSISVTNAFTTLSDAIDKLVQSVHSNNNYTGIYLNFHERGGDDYHYLFSDVNESTEFADRVDYSYSNPPHGIQLDYGEDDGLIKFSVSKSYSKIMQEFNKADKGSPFIWFGIYSYGGTKSWKECVYASSDEEGNGNKERKYARIWWRTKNPSYPWALLEKYATDSTNVVSAIKAHFKDPDNTYICFYKQTNLSGFYTPNTNNLNYNNEYNLNTSITATASSSSDAELKDVQYSGASDNRKPFRIIFSLKSKRLTQSVNFNQITLNSSDQFQTVVSQSGNIPTDKVILDTGLNVDNENNELEMDSVYVNTSDGLVKVNSGLQQITPHSLEYGGQYYGFLYGNSNTITTGTPDNTAGSYKYDFAGSSDRDSDTSLLYSNINMVKKQSITNGF